MTALNRSGIWRVFLLLGLCCFIVGCSGYRQIALPDPASAGDSAQAQLKILKKGMDVRVTLNSGKKLTGKVIDITEVSLTIGKPGNYGFQKTEIPRADILSVEAEQGTLMGNIVTNTLMVAISGAIILVIVVALSCRNGCALD